ncbi:amidohydrolase family protein, partial [Shewanella algae]|uniref:amidohydrolase family protein n=1 Tax=Shewanella algae TaxID=38313 RepID=UPI00313CB87A
KVARELGQLHRVILDTDSPAGSGVQPLGILRMMALLSGLGGLSGAEAVCLATGNTARIRNLAGGLLEAGRPADFVFLDKAQHSAGKDTLECLEVGDL